jgi:hypothetical protein
LFTVHILDAERRKSSTHAGTGLGSPVQQQIRRNEMKRFRTKIFALTGLIAAAIGVMLAAPAAAPASVGGFYEIVNPVFNKCLDVPNGSTQPGTRIQAFHCLNNNNQLWAPLILDDQGHLLWQNRGNGLCLHVTSGFSGASVDQQPCDGVDTAQRWRWGLADFIGHLVLVSDFPNLCLALRDATIADGTPIVIRDCATTATQFFRIDS